MAARRQEKTVKWTPILLNIPPTSSLSFFSCQELNGSSAEVLTLLSQLVALISRNLSGVLQNCDISLDGIYAGLSLNQFNSSFNIDELSGHIHWHLKFYGDFQLHWHFTPSLLALHTFTFILHLNVYFTYFGLDGTSWATCTWQLSTWHLAL